jgi:hypothetical protein
MLERGRTLLERARAIGDPVRELAIVGRLMPACLIGGHADEAAVYEARTEELVAQLGARRPPWSRTGRCGRLRATGQITAALGCYREFEDLARIEQDPLLLMNYYRNSAELLAIENRDYAAALSLAERGVEHSVRLGEWWNRVELTGTLAVIVAGLGDVARADQLINDVAREKHGDVFAEAYLAHCIARVHELAGRTAEAEGAYRDATARFKATGFGRGFWLAQLLLDHARLLHELGRDGEAAALVAESEGLLGPQAGERPARIAALKSEIARTRTRR